MNFTQLVLTARPNIKPNSAKAYATSLKLLAPDGATDFSYLFEVEPILLKLEKYKPTTRRNYLNAIIVVLKGVEGTEGVLKQYEKIRDKYNEEYNEQVQTHTKTERQKAIWIDWPDYLEVVDTLRDKTAHLRSEPWNPKQKQAYQDYLITMLYSKYPLRNDWADVMVITKTEYNKLGGGDKKQGNYLVKHDTNKYFFVLNEYKTSKKYGENHIEIDADILAPLRRWLRHNDSGYLLINSHNKPMQANGVSKLLTRVGQQRLGRNLGSSLLRHSYLSHKYKAVTLEKQKDADLMMHSEAMQQAYIK